MKISNCNHTALQKLIMAAPSGKDTERQYQDVSGPYILPNEFVLFFHNLQTFIPS